MIDGPWKRLSPGQLPQKHAGPTPILKNLAFECTKLLRNLTDF
jgi:hypothetical protein